MSPQQAHSLVGHSPQTRDIVEQATFVTDEALMDAMSAEIERLRTALRSVRACTDPAWIAQIVKDALREED